MDGRYIDYYDLPAGKQRALSLANPDTAALSAVQTAIARAAHSREPVALPWPEWDIAISAMHTRALATLRFKGEPVWRVAVAADASSAESLWEAMAGENAGGLRPVEGAWCATAPVHPVHDATSALRGAPRPVLPDALVKCVAAAWVERWQAVRV